MFEGPNYPQNLDESLFDEQLEKGRSSKIPYAYLIVFCDELDQIYAPVFVEERSEPQNYARYCQAPNHQLLVAAYDLYSETRVIQGMMVTCLSVYMQVAFDSPKNSWKTEDRSSRKFILTGMIAENHIKFNPNLFSKPKDYLEYLTLMGIKPRKKYQYLFRRSILPYRY